MTRFFLAAVLAAGLAIAADSYSINFAKPVVVGSTEMKPGDYKLELDGNKATLRNKKNSVEADVTVENAGEKYRLTSSCCLGDDGKYHLQEIRVGGTNTKVLFKEPSGLAVCR